jgi:hypothetical protein
MVLGPRFAHAWYGTSGTSISSCSAAGTGTT